jgi:hypothetical protein
VLATANTTEKKGRREHIEEHDGVEAMGNAGSRQEEERGARFILEVLLFYPLSSQNLK